MYPGRLAMAVAFRLRGPWLLFQNSGTTPAFLRAVRGQHGFSAEYGGHFIG
jgi:hypothetical protein